MPRTRGRTAPEGYPTGQFRYAENTHQVAQRLCQFARVLYVDNDPVVLAPAEVMRSYIDALPSGSYVVFSHLIDPENEYSPTAQRVQAILNQSINRGFFRTRAEIEEMPRGLELIEPGLVSADDWWPAGPRQKPLPDAGHCIVAAVGRKP